jgi:hypothetical protein
MPQDAPGSLTREQNAELVAFLLQQNGYTPGDRELPSSDDALQDILIEP